MNGLVDIRSRRCALCFYLCDKFGLDVAEHSLDDIEIFIDSCKGKGLKLPIFLHCKYIINPIANITINIDLTFSIVLSKFKE